MENPEEYWMSQGKAVIMTSELILKVLSQSHPKIGVLSVENLKMIADVQFKLKVKEQTPRLLKVLGDKAKVILGTIPLHFISEDGLIDIEPLNRQSWIRVTNDRIRIGGVGIGDSPLFHSYSNGTFTRSDGRRTPLIWMEFDFPRDIGVAMRAMQEVIRLTAHLRFNLNPDRF